MINKRMGNDDIDKADVRKKRHNDTAFVHELQHQLRMICLQNLVKVVIFWIKRTKSCKQP